MRNAYIKFDSDREYTQVSEMLVSSAPVTRLSNGIFCIPWGSLAMLDESDVCYSFASESDIASAHPVWNFASPKPR